GAAPRQHAAEADGDRAFPGAPRRGAAPRAGHLRQPLRGRDDLGEPGGRPRRRHPDVGRHRVRHLHQHDAAARRPRRARGGRDRGRHRARHRRDPERHQESASPMTRSFDRAATQLRPVRFTRNFTRHAEGSVLVEMGDTRVLCTASVEEKVPPFLKGKGTGWVTAEYGMLPRATHTRGSREAATGKQSGRTQEIQRLIGRSLRAVTDLKALGERQITLDCDVVQADGGTRTAAITGAWVALRLATRYLLDEEVLKADPILDQVAAVSCGVFSDTPVLDLDYEEDSTAEADANFVLTGNGDIVEIQATGERRGFTRAEFEALYGLAEKGIAELFAIQRAAAGR